MEAHLVFWWITFSFRTSRWKTTGVQATSWTFWAQLYPTGRQIWRRQRNGLGSHLIQPEITLSDHSREPDSPTIHWPRVAASPTPNYWSTETNVPARQRPTPYSTCNNNLSTEFQRQRLAMTLQITRPQPYWTPVGYSGSTRTTTSTTTTDASTAGRCTAGEVESHSTGMNPETYPFLSRRCRTVVAARGAHTRYWARRPLVAHWRLCNDFCITSC